MSVPTVSEVLRLANLDVADQDLTSTCEKCGAQRDLSECKAKEDGTVRSYRCGLCNRLLVEVGRQSAEPIEMGCYHVGDWVIRPTTDLFAHIKGHKVKIGAKRPAIAAHEA